MFELDNNQRKYFGLNPVLETWDKVEFKEDNYRPKSILYYEGNTIKKHVIKTGWEYKEIQYNEQTENRELILPKTKKGKSKRLTASVLEARTPIGVYLNLNSSGNLIIGNYTIKITFYSRIWEYKIAETDLKRIIKEFIKNFPKDHFKKIEEFRKAKRKNVKYKSGDFFVFKINRTEYGFGRILFDVNKARKKKLIPKNHRLNMLMGLPILIKIYAYKSEKNAADIKMLKNKKSLPSDFIMDNVVIYGEFEIFNFLPLEIDEFDFPISYGMRIDKTPNVFLQWGMIHKELPKEKFNKYFMPINGILGKHNPFGYYSIGFRPKFDTQDINNTITNNGVFDFSKCRHYNVDYDLRNSKNDLIRNEIFKTFGLNQDKNYKENVKITGTKDIIKIIEEIE